MKKTIILFGVSFLLFFFVTNCKTTKQIAFIPKAPATTGNVKELTRVTDDPVAEFYPDISPDGTKLLCHVRDDNKTGGERFSIVLINLGSPGRTPLVGAYTNTPSWYPDSKTFVYQYSKPGKPIVARSSIESAGITYISTNPMGETDERPKVSHNGKKIAFDTGIGGSDKVCMMDVTGMNFTILTDGVNPCWSSDETTIVYQKDVGNFTHLFLYNLQTGQSTQITSGDNNNLKARFSPDGKMLVFESDRDKDAYHIYVMKSDGTAITQLTQGKSSEGNPCWASDGYIYFQSNAGAPNTANGIWSYSDIWKLKPNLIL